MTTDRRPQTADESLTLQVALLFEDICWQIQFVVVDGIMMFVIGDLRSHTTFNTARAGCFSIRATVYPHNFGWRKVSSSATLRRTQPADFAD